MPSAREQVEEQVRIFDGIMNLWYQKCTNFTIRIFITTLGPNVAQRNVIKSIDVKRRKQVQSASQFVQVAAATDGGCMARGNVEDMNTGSAKKDFLGATANGKDDVANDHGGVEEARDDVGCDPIEVTVLQTEKIHYMVKLESWGEM